MDPNKTKSTFNINLTTEESLARLEISSQVYYWAKCCVNLQPFHDYYKTITYMITYFLKSETETTKALKHALHEIRTQNIASACNFIKKETLVQVFFCEFCEIFYNTFSYRTPPVAASLAIECSER